VNPTLFLAGLPDDIAPMMAMVLVFGIPIIAILTSHQRKMAEMFHGRRDQNLDAQILMELQNMRSELTMLKQRVNDVTLAVDDQKRLTQRLNSSEQDIQI